MDVRGIVVSFEDNVQVAKNGGGFYPGARFTYRDDTGAIKERGFHNNVFKFNPGLKTQLSNLNAGQPFVMNMEKEGEFWQVKSVLPEEGNSMAPKTEDIKANKTNPYTSPKSTYETPEERAKKQVYIVRQSSINQAIEYHGSKASIEAILKTAATFEGHVFGKDYDNGTIEGLANDTDGII